MNLTPDIKKIKRAFARTPVDDRESGCCATYVKLDKYTGAKVYADPDYRDMIRRRQARAASKGMGPKVGRRFAVIIPERYQEWDTEGNHIIIDEMRPTKKYGYVTESLVGVGSATSAIMTAVNSQFLRIVGRHYGDSHAGNYGKRRGTKKWMPLDFD